MKRLKTFDSLNFDKEDNEITNNEILNNIDEINKIKIENYDPSNKIQISKILTENVGTFLIQYIVS